MTTKRCTKCGGEKPASADYFTRRASSRDGLGPECRICVRVRNAAKRGARLKGGA